MKLRINLFLAAALLSHFMTADEAFGFVLPIFSPMVPTTEIYRRRQSAATSLQMSMVSRQPFNPFSQRSKNIKVRWFEADLDAFYAFVENQPLLTADQELQYGKAMRMWVQVEQMRTHMEQDNSTGAAVPVTNAELAAVIGCSATMLGNMSRYAEVSKTRLVNSNLKLVLAVVSRYRTAGIPNAELIAEGTRGLSKAVLRYDYSKGFRFATYATWYVHQAIADYVRWRKHPAKMPSRYLLLQRKVKDFSAEFKAINGRQPTILEMSQSLSQKQYDIIKVLTMQTYPTLLGTPAKSAKTRVDSGKERTFEELIPSMHKAPLAQTDSKDLRRDMEQMMNTNLNDVERDVLRLRLGLDVKAVKEVGKRFKISWKQVRTVEKEALSKLLGSEEITEFVESYNSV
jgi:RNA polymerase sigma factor (sigma-70 family)